MSAYLETSASNQTPTGSPSRCRPGDDPSAHWSLWWNEHNIPGLRRLAAHREMDRIAEERYRAIPEDETDYDQWHAMDECPSPAYRMMPGYCTAYEIMRPDSIRRKREVAASMPQRRYPSPPTSPLPLQPLQQPPQPPPPQVNHLPTSHEENPPLADLPQTASNPPPALSQTNAPPADPLQRDTLSPQLNPSAENEASGEDGEKHENEEDDRIESENKGHSEFNEEQGLPLAPVRPQSNACSAEDKAASEDGEKHEKEEDDEVESENKGHSEFNEEQGLPLAPVRPQSNACSAEDKAASEDGEKHEKEEDDEVESENKEHSDSSEEQDLPLPPIRPHSNAFSADFPQSVVPLPDPPQPELIRAISTASHPSNDSKLTKRKRKASQSDDDEVGETTGSQLKKRRNTTDTFNEKVKGRRIRSTSLGRTNDHS